MSVTPELLRKIKDAVNIIEVVGEHVVLRKSGSNFSGLCPFHSERSPSFSVSEQKQLYHCYGCKEGGDLVSFVMKIHGMSFPEAIQELADRAGIVIPQSGPAGEPAAHAEQRKRAETCFKLNRFVASFYRSEVANSSAAREYLASRNVNSEMEKAFYLGFAPAQWDSLAKRLISAQAPMELALELGLIRPSTKVTSSGIGYFDLFRNRIIFPIADSRGKVVGFGGRTLPGGTPENANSANASGAPVQKDPKYLNSTESFVFHKSKILYGLFQAKKHIREKDESILVEGNFDVIALHQAGFQNAVATCGTALTREHLAQLLRLGNKVIALFDGDAAGQQAMDRAMELGLDGGVIIHGAFLPEELDPDELLQLPGGKERLEDLLKKAQPLLDLRIAQALEEAQRSPEEKTQALKKIGAWLKRYQDPVGRDVRFEWVQEKIRLPRATLLQAMGVSAPEAGRQAPGASVQASRNPQGNAQNNKQTEFKPRPSPSGGKRRPAPEISRAERLVFSVLAFGGPLADQVIARTDGRLPPQTAFSSLFDVQGARQFIDFLLGEGRHHPAEKRNEIALSQLELDPQVRSIITEGSLQGVGTFQEEEVRAAMDLLLWKSWARFSQQLKHALTEAETRQDADLQEKLMKDYLDVQRRMKEFNSFYDQVERF